jgi:phospholipid/cholesterol/gamma-HCH transport system ATP-binding protein
MLNAGQNCGAVERVYVEEAASKELILALTEQVKALRLGTDIGRLATPAQRAIVERHVQDAKDKGARVLVGGDEISTAGGSELERLRERFGYLFQGGALLAWLSVLENVALPLREFTRLPKKVVAEIVALKLALVGLAGFENYYPSEISGGMKKRAGLARAMALDPEILFFDEPSAGLDPLSSQRLDELILELRNGLGATVVLVTHELPSIFAIANNSVFLDAETRTMIAAGDPKLLLKEGPDQVRHFLQRGQP